MKTIDYYILDVFAKQKYGGNQLAVYLDLADELSHDDMLSMAKEINFAESTFIKKQTGSNQYIVKIFTTESEIPFAGHPTLGTSYAIAKYLMNERPKEVVLQLPIGDISVTLSEAEDLDQCLFTMTQAQPTFLQTFSKEEISTQLGIEASFIRDDAPIREISTGLPYIIIPIKDLTSIENISLSPQKFTSFLLENGIHRSNNPNQLSTSLFFYTPHTYEAENDYNTRMFCVEDDILKEDSATGSANGCFLAYLLRYINAEISVKVEQGFQMNRKSYLYLTGKASDNVYDIKVGGYSKTVSKGQWIVD